MSERFDKICGECYYFLNERVEGNQFSGGSPAGDCHGAVPKAGEGFPVIDPNSFGCPTWKQGGEAKKIIRPPEPTPEPPAKKEIIIEDGMPPIQEEPCQSTSTSVHVESGSTISRKPGDESVPLSRADVGKELSESRPVLDSLSGEPSIKTSPTETRP